MYSDDILYARLAKDEDVRNLAYLDTRGNITAGVGHNLSVKPISDTIIKEWFQEDITYAYKCLQEYSWFEGLDDARQSVLVCLMFNIGPGNFAKFVNMIDLLGQGNFLGAANEMEDSIWARQVGKDRSKLYSDILRTGLWPSK